MANIITIDRLTVMLGKGYTALDDVSVELAAGTTIGLIGPSGAGKTTLIRAIVGRQRASRGRVTVLGLPAGSPKLRARLSYMTQELSVYSDLTVAENVRYFASMAGYDGRAGKAMCQQALARVDLARKAGALVSDLSGGQKQRVSLAVALLGEPELLVLDEPTVGLDPVLRQQLWKLFRELRDAGTSIIISSHVMDEAERCDDLVLIRGGHIIAHATPHDFLRQTATQTVEAGFLKLAGDAV